MSNTKLTLPAFLKILSDGNMPMAKAMALASKIYKTHNTPAVLGKLTDGQLKALGVEHKDDRKLALAAFKRAGYKSGTATTSTNAEAGPSSAAGTKKASPKKRKRDDDLNELLPNGPPDEGAEHGSFEFNEVLDEESLRTKSAVVNRAPVMTAWSTIVAERLGFKREEALSITSAYTEMNAISKGVSLGIFESSKGKGVELLQGESQPYVDLMGRRMYAEFRPDVDGWGKRAEMRCATVLSLRKQRKEEQVPEEKQEEQDVKPVIKTEVANDKSKSEGEEPPAKKAKTMTVEEYEAALDDSVAYDELTFGDEF